MLLEACGGSDSTSAPLHKLLAKSRSVDVAILNRGLDLEYRAVAAYTAGIPLLSGDAARVAEQFLGQELSHAGELYGLVKEAKGEPHNQQQSYPIGHSRSESEVLALLHELELAQISFYLAAIPNLTPGPVRAAVASVLANDAQHLAFVRASMHRPPLTSPFVTGQR
jgi:hypothetical protein